VAKTDRQDVEREAWPRCDCGYTCVGQTAAERAEDGRRHAAEVHGIDVSTEAVLEAPLIGLGPDVDREG
jgi:hypothetical protein